jgi:hypothetical protein
MTTSEITNFDQKNQTDLSTSSSQKLSFLKTVQYFSLAGFVFVCLLYQIFPNNQLIVIWGAVFLSTFIFLFLTNRQVSQEYRNTAKQLDLGRKAELYACLLDPNTSLENKSISLARQKALQYCQELIDDYKKTRETARNIYYIFQLATVILSGVTPILVLVDKLEAGQAWLKWLPVICPAVASIVASIVTSFPFEQNSIAANTTVELLEAEQEKFILGVTPAYRCYDVTDEGQRQQQAKMAIENFINQVNTIHLKQIQESDKTQPQEENTAQAQSSAGRQKVATTSTK